MKKSVSTIGGIFLLMNAQYGTNKGKNVVVDPVNKITPEQITLTGSQTGTKTFLFLGDACGAASALGLLPTGNSDGTEFTVDGAGRQPLKELLKTYAIVIDQWDMEATVQAEMSRNVELIRVNQDGTSCIEKLFTSKSRTNMAENALLLNLVNGFVLTSSTAIKQVTGATSATDNTLTFYPKAIVPYAVLADYLSANPTYK